ncbi:MAG TPA: DUF882 domain-containing protein [Caulobacteraceae bacterium]|jgi:uncharacterized protein YcbK (DUF882 family)|nr:DUF882 domain-containing protein [Caulobacteraceae bacterium]
MGIGAAVFGAASPTLGWAAPLTNADMRCVAFDNLHTGESMEGVYWEQGEYVPDVLAAVNNLLRDHRTGDVYPIAPQLLDLLDAVTAATGTRARFQVISGYRSPKTNEMLHERSAEVAKKSLHTEGLAIDVRLPDVDLSRLHSAAMSLERGGVGYYPHSDFVHLDVGPTRTWYGT